MGTLATAGRGFEIAMGDISANTKLATACKFINAEVARLRNHTIGIWILSVFGSLGLSLVLGFDDPRILLVLGVGASAISYVRARSELASSYKGVAARRIVALLGSDMTYRTGSSLTRQQLTATDLFQENVARTVSSDEIIGRTHSARYSIQHVRAFGLEKNAMVFDGTVIRIDFVQTFAAHTVIVPDRAGDSMNGWRGSGTGRSKDLVMLKHPAFERLYDVYSTDYYETKKILTQGFMQDAIDAHALFDNEPRFCFLGKTLWIAIPGHAATFDTSLFAPPLTPETAVGNLAVLVSVAERFSLSCQ